MKCSARLMNGRKQSKNDTITDTDGNRKGAKAEQ